MIVFAVPLFLWIGTLLVFATDRGGYNATWSLVIRAVGFLTPDFPKLPTDNHTLELSMYQINQALRRLAHIIAYAALALLVVRTLQWGRPRLRVASVLVMVAFSALITGAESFVRLKIGTQRHVRVEQFYLNMLGTGIALFLTFFFFGIKALERHLTAPPPTE